MIIISSFRTSICISVYLFLSIVLLCLKHSETWVAFSPFCVPHPELFKDVLWTASAKFSTEFQPSTYSITLLIEMHS